MLVLCGGNLSGMDGKNSKNNQSCSIKRGVLNYINFYPINNVEVSGCVCCVGGSEYTLSTSSEFYNKYFRPTVTLSRRGFWGPDVSTHPYNGKDSVKFTNGNLYIGDKRVGLKYDWSWEKYAKVNLTGFLFGTGIGVGIGLGIYYGLLKNPKIMLHQLKTL